MKIDFDEANLAIIPYIGASGSSHESSEAILDILCRGDKLNKVRLLSSPPSTDNNTRSHGFYLEFECLGWFVVSSGFASGYGGTGPHELSKIIAIIYDFNSAVKEIELSAEQFKRLQHLSLTHEDIYQFHESSDFHGASATDYIFEHTWIERRQKQLLSGYEPRLPLTGLHPSLQSLVKKIFSEPSDALRESYIILESKIRDLSGLDGHGTKMFDEALKPRQGVLKLKGHVDSGEQAGLQNLIKGLYQLHRNPRMHRLDENMSDGHSNMSEFLAINHIMRLTDKLEINEEREHVVEK